jgi:hypothetical protein
VPFRSYHAFLARGVSVPLSCIPIRQQIAHGWLAGKRGNATALVKKMHLITKEK